MIAMWLSSRPCAGIRCGVSSPQIFLKSWILAQGRDDSGEYVCKKKGGREASLFLKHMPVGAAYRRSPSKRIRLMNR